jgi:hypothetical protein
MPLTLAEITAELFRNKEGFLFRFRQPAQTGYVDLELLQVTEGQSALSPTGRAIPFSLLFRPVDNVLLEPGLPWFVHPEVEPCEISVQRVMPPGGFPPAAVYYEAVFN